MNTETEGHDRPAQKRLHHEQGRTYFTRETERKLFFIMTVAMLVSGIFVKIGWF